MFIQETLFADTSMPLARKLANYCTFDAEQILRHCYQSDYQTDKTEVLHQPMPNTKPVEAKSLLIIPS